MKKRAIGRWAAMATSTALMAATSACGSSTADASSGSAGGGGASTTDQSAVNAWYKGTYKEPQGPAIQPPKGKDIWLVSSGMGIEYSVRIVKAAKEAAADLGWSLHVIDAKFDPTQQLTGVQQAVVAHAGGIIIETIDCDTVKNGAQQAQAAGIPVVAIESADCSPKLYSDVVGYSGKESFEDWIQDFGRAQAAWVIAKTNGEAKVVLNTETDTATTRLASAGIKTELKKCTTCTILDDVTWVAGDYGPGLQAKIQQTMVKHPDANAFIPAYDSVMTQSGGAQALQSTGRLAHLVVAGGEGSGAGIAQVRNGGGMQMCAGQSPEWESYAAVDALARLFLKRDPSEVDSGNGIQVCDKDHNLPAAGKAFTPPVDFAAAYRKLWGLS